MEKIRAVSDPSETAQGPKALSAAIRAIRGFRDIPPEEAWRYRQVEDRILGHLAGYGYREIRLPLLEPTELFARGIGEGTDIVEKEMYTFSDRNGQSLTLRPEGTASVVRAYLEGNWGASGGIAKVAYSGPMFRYERPQKGRYRQFYQVGVEAIGSVGPMVDAEILDLLHRLFAALGVRDVRLLVNSLGCPVCRPGYRAKLVEFLRGAAGGFCGNCVRRLGTNPLRVLDCKVPQCREAVVGAPVMLDHLCGECGAHFASVRAALDGLAVPYEIDPMIVRGLDYYNRTAFEVVSTGLGAQNAVAAGGRYDGLAREIGGDVPGIGFAVGLERLCLLVDWEGRLPPASDFYVAAATESTRLPALALADRIRDRGGSAETDLEGRSLKAQLRSANRLGVRTVLILGDDEIRAGTVQVRDFSSGLQETVPMDRFLAGLGKGGVES